MLKSWPDSAARLIAVAMGREKADMVVRGAPAIGNAALRASGRFITKSGGLS